MSLDQSNNHIDFFALGRAVERVLYEGDISKIIQHKENILTTQNSTLVGLFGQEETGNLCFYNIPKDENGNIIADENGQVVLTDSATGKTMTNHIDTLS